MGEDALAATAVPATGEAVAPARPHKAFVPLAMHHAPATPPPPAFNGRGLAGVVRRPEWEAVTGQLLGRATWFHNWSAEGHLEGLTFLPTLWGKGAWRNSGIADCLAYVAEKLGRNYAGKLLWLNEPNDVAQANLRPEEAAVFYEETKQALPQAQLIGPTLSFYNATKWQAEANWLRSWHSLVIQRIGTRPLLAGMAVHNYEQDVAEHIRLHEAWERLLADLGYGHLPLWVTEWGISNEWPDAEERTAALVDYYNRKRLCHAWYINADWGDDTGFAIPTFLQDVRGLTGTGRGWMRGR